MAAADITLTNANVNSGTAIVILGGTIRYDWKNITRADPVDGKYDIVESHYGGFENPIISVTGIFDVDNKASLSNIMTHAMLVNFATVKSGTTTLKVSLGSTPLVLGGRPTNGYSTSGSNTLDTTNGVDVQIDSFSISASSGETIYGRGASYTIMMHETA